MSEFLDAAFHVSLNFVISKEIGRWGHVSLDLNTQPWFEPIRIGLH